MPSKNLTKDHCGLTKNQLNELLISCYQRGITDAIKATEALLERKKMQEAVINILKR